MQKVLPSGLGLLRGGRARTIASDRVFKSTVHCTHNILINNEFNLYSYTHCTIVDYFLEKSFLSLDKTVSLYLLSNQVLEKHLKATSGWIAETISSPPTKSFDSLYVTRI